MSPERKLEDIASNLDDISETLDEIRSSVDGGDCSSGMQPLDEIRRKVDQAATAIDEAVDPD